MKKLTLIICLMVFASSCTQETVEKAQLDETNVLNVQGVSLLGEQLIAAEATPEAIEKMEEARLAYMADPANADALVWWGRRIAYTCDYLRAIEIYTEGMKKFPEDARFPRHRGHRYISIREFDKAIADFRKAAELREGMENQIEPDGMPNARNIPVSTLHGNIYYHLGLAYYLKNDMENARDAYTKCLEASELPDNIVSASHWLYMINRRLGDEVAANLILEPINAEMDIIENMAYHKLCLFYKGEVTLDELTQGEYSDIMTDASWYGVGNWYLYNGEREKAREVFAKILEGKSWASFGYIAAEADFAREFK